MKFDQHVRNLESKIEHHREQDKALKIQKSDEKFTNILGQSFDASEAVNEAQLFEEALDQKIKEIINQIQENAKAKESLIQEKLSSYKQNIEDEKNAEIFKALELLDREYQSKWDIEQPKIAEEFRLKAEKELQDQVKQLEEEARDKEDKALRLALEQESSKRIKEEKLRLELEEKVKKQDVENEKRRLKVLEHAKKQAFEEEKLLRELEEKTKESEKLKRELEEEAKKQALENEKHRLELEEKTKKDEEAASLPKHGTEDSIAEELIITHGSNQPISLVELPKENESLKEPLDETSFELNRKVIAKSKGACPKSSKMEETEKRRSKDKISAKVQKKHQAIQKGARKDRDKKDGRGLEEQEEKNNHPIPGSS